MQTSFYKFLKNGFILKNLETQPTLPSGLNFSQLKEKKKLILGDHDKSSNIKNSDQSSHPDDLGLHRINSLPTWKSSFSN